MTIRKKIKEIVENIDKFENYLVHRIKYKNIEILCVNSCKLYINDTEINLYTKEINCLTKIAYKKWEKGKEKMHNADLEKQDKALNSISFNEEESK